MQVIPRIGVMVYGHFGEKHYPKYIHPNSNTLKLYSEVRLVLVKVV